MARGKGNMLLVAAGIGAFVVIYPLVWLHERIGTTGLVGLVAVVVGWLLYQLYAGSAAQLKRDAAFLQRFEADAVQAMKGLQTRPDVVAVIKRRYRALPSHMVLIRQLQVFGESAQLALQSKKPETANGRFQSAMACYSEVVESKAEFPSDVIWRELEECRCRLVGSFPSAWRVNAATSLLQQAEGLKTNTAKRKRWQQVVDLLTDPEMKPTPQMDELRASALTLLETSKDLK